MVYNWHRKWRDEGIEGLLDEPRSGRLALATPEYCAKLEASIETDPTELGYGFTLWTAERLLAHLEKETGIRMIDDTLRSLLQKHGYVYHRPKHDLKNLQDAEARALAQESLETLKKSQRRGNPTILCGRSNPSSPSSLTQMLDEARSAASHSCRWTTATASLVRSLQLLD